jgi:phosphatidylinositol N-acetylglucosaminyltransferase subunit A
MVSDFFYPRLGGVEMHIFNVASALLKLGHHVIMVTGTYNYPLNAYFKKEKRIGVRVFTNGLKVYYLPILGLFDQVTVPLFFSHMWMMYDIFQREKTQIVHGHAITSTFSNDCFLIAQSLGIKTVFSDHSLFGFSNIPSINISKYAQFALCNIDAAVCVSFVDKENLSLRAKLDPKKLFVIPNAVDSDMFYAKLEKRPRDKGVINVVLVSRLVYRKGIDLVLRVIPVICKEYSNVHFIVGGDGDKRHLLDELVEREKLHRQVEILGALPHYTVPEVLNRGHIFLNCSLTESFCIAVLEGAACGNLVVATNVGGVGEVLPPDMVHYSSCDTDDILRALRIAIKQVSQSNVYKQYTGSESSFDCNEANNDGWDPEKFNARVAAMYTWEKVGMKTESLYRTLLSTPSKTLREIFLALSSLGPLYGKACMLIFAIVYLHKCIIQFFFPPESIEPVPIIDLTHVAGVITSTTAATHTSSRSRSNTKTYEHSGLVIRSPVLVSKEGFVFATPIGLDDDDISDR